MNTDQVHSDFTEVNQREPAKVVRGRRNGGMREPESHAFTQADNLKVEEVDAFVYHKEDRGT